MRVHIYFLFIIIVSLLASGCLKDGFGIKNKYYFSCTLFKEHLIEAKDKSGFNIGGIYKYTDVSFFKIYASPEENETFEDYFVIRLQDSTEFENGTIYSNLPGEEIVQPALYFHFSYYVSITSSFRSASIQEISSEGSGLKPFFVQITEVTDSYISGTFHGTVYKHNTSGVTTFENPVSVKDGKFKVPR